MSLFAMSNIYPERRQKEIYIILYLNFLNYQPDLVKTQGPQGSDRRDLKAMSRDTDGNL